MNATERQLQQEIIDDYIAVKQENAELKKRLSMAEELLFEMLMSNSNIKYGLVLTEDNPPSSPQRE